MGFWDKLNRQLDELAEELVPDSIRFQTDEARQLLVDGHPREAVAILEQVIRARPQQSHALYLLGYARARLGEHEAARDAFLRAGVVKPGFVEALLGLGHASLELGRWDEALAAFREARVRAGGRGSLLAMAYRGLGRAHLALGDTARGIRELRKALVEDATDLQAATLLAETDLASGGVGGDERTGHEQSGRQHSPSIGADTRRLLGNALTHADDGDDDWRGRAEAALGRLELAAGHGEKAELSLRKALIDLDPAAIGLRVAVLVALAEAAVATGRTGEGMARLVEAVDLAPSDPVVHLRLAGIHEQAGAHQAALSAYEAAAELGEPTARAAALRLAVQLERWDTVTRHADALGDAPAAVWARMWVAIAGTPLGGDQLIQARSHATAVLAQSPTLPVARRVLAEATRRAVGAPPSDAYGAATQAVTLTRMFPLLAAHEADAAAIVRAHDSPLTVVVMGEFSTGKSTFVNAFLGEQVAPMGARPTTSVIHVMRYGAQPGGRILYADGGTREVAWDELPGVLQELGQRDAASIRQVEVRYPNDTLTRVHIVDTPGLNSVLPEHEQVARGFVTEADAVVWLFSASQAGKESEREALTQVRAHGKHVVGVLNKVDQLSAQESTELMEFLRGALGELVEAFIPLSARAALAARGTADEEALAASGWTALESELEQRFFQRARSLKEETARRHLDGLVAAMRGRVLAARDDLDRSRTRAVAAADDVRILRDSILRETIPTEEKSLRRETADVFRLAAREILDLVKPRRVPFGSHEATRADRDYIVGLLEREIPAVVGPTLERLVSLLGTIGVAGADFSAERDRYNAFVRGLLRGGRIDTFFTAVLPRLELQEDAVYHSLSASSPDVGEELVVPLTARLRQLLDARVASLEHDAAHLDRALFELDDILLPLLDSLG